MFIGPIERTGRITLLVASACLFIPGTYLYVFHGLFPPVDALFRALVGVWSFAIVFSVVEPVIYFTLIGFGGTYMSFLTGNLVNLRLPISVTAQQVVGTTEGTPEAEIVSTLAVAGSLVTSQLVLTAGVLLLMPVFTGLNDPGSAVGMAFRQVLPALLGAVAGMFIFRNARLGILPVGTGVAMALVSTSLKPWFTVLPLVILSIAGARLMYRRGWLK